MCLKSNQTYDEFSLASAPDEGLLLVATRMRDTAFKRVLGTMPIGSQVKIEGPFGNLVLHNDQARAGVFLAGGIGITPFRSILLRAAREHLPHRLFLFYANRRPEDAPFLQELDALQRLNPSYIFIPTMTDMSRSHRPWQGETGVINQEMLAKHLKVRRRRSTTWPGHQGRWGHAHLAKRHEGR